MPRTKESTEYIRQEFTPDERLKMGAELAQCHNRIADIEDEEAVVKSQIKERKTQVEQTISSLSRKLAAGFDMINVKCKLVYDQPQVNEVSYVRIDTGAVVKVRAMNSDEMQEELPLTDAEGKVEVIPPAVAEASAEKSAENIASFFEAGKQMAETAPQDEFVDEVGPLPEEQQVADATGTPGDELFTEEYIDEKGKPVTLPETPTKAKPRQPRGFSKPANETAW